MNDSTYKFWDNIIKTLGFVATVASILIGIAKVNKEQKIAAELEFNRNFWHKQNEVYAEVCRNAGLMVATVGDAKVFNDKKQVFLGLYYGELVLVEDAQVEKAMLNLESYLKSFDPTDENMVNTLANKVLDLSKACKNSSETFKRAKLE